VEGKCARRAFTACGTRSFHRLANADVPADVRKTLAGHDSDEAHARYTHLAFTKQTRLLPNCRDWRLAIAAIGRGSIRHPAIL